MKPKKSAIYGILTAFAVVIALGGLALTQAQRTSTPEAPPAPSANAVIPPAPETTVAGQALVNERFDQAVNWERINDSIIHEYQAQWAVEKGHLALKQPQAGANIDSAIYLVPQTVAADTTLAAQFYPQGNQAIGLVFSYSDDGYYVFRVFADSSDLVYRYTLERVQPTTGLTRLAELRDDTSRGYVYNSWQELRVVRDGATITCFFGETKIFEVEDAVLGKGQVGVYAANMGDVLIDNFTVAR